MFTGIIEEIGQIISITPAGDGFHIKIKAQIVCEETGPGDSVSVNGICLTVVELISKEISVEAVKETVDRTTLSELKPGAPVNLERALRANGRFGGHFVQGHVDDVGVVESIRPQKLGHLLTVRAEANVLKFMVQKGSIAVDGISLTVASKHANSFTIALIPYTVNNTALKYIKVGDKVNLEVDLLGKYAYQFLHASEEEGITDTKLSNFGFI